MSTFNQYHIRYNNYFVVILDITNILKETLDEDQLFDLLDDICDKWYEIGLALHVHPNFLDDPQLRHCDDTFRLSNIINRWVNHSSSVTWEMVINAMESPIVKNKAKAEMICHYLSTGKSNKLLMMLKVKLVVIHFVISVKVSL